MKPEWYLCFGGIELSNHARVASYINNIGISDAAVEVPLDCACAHLNTGFSYPWSDPAPWYEITRPESRDFLGLLVTDMTLQPVARRNFTQAGRNGSMLGPLSLSGRILQVQGQLWATTAEGMAYGERWLAEALKGSSCSDGECPSDDILILPACPEQVGYDLQLYLRTLVRGGLIDGPVPSPIVKQECNLQGVAFQLGSSQPWMYHQPVRCLDAQTVTGELGCAFTTPEWMGEGTFRVEVENTGTTTATNIVIQGQISLDGTCPVNGLASSVPPSWTYTIPTLAAESKLIIDGARVQTLLYDESDKVSRSALPYITFDGPFVWPDVGPCTTMCLSITRSTGTVIATVDRYLREI